ncbi:alpha/beta fold hydrolase [Metabacillus arenae]|uniref:Alpha/beta hydrolase n=1 Tax=Metabacillus arenae TaxID=2771434 RepID=A0A926RY21_9BACI|nr:alpha/beta hydrolase [Metabacillus arenae]MBD1381586.1 alpha/beta hydrolase [Metabacillus arenae]
MELYKQNISEDISISYIDKGVGDCIVLLHGFCGSHEYFKYLIPELSKRHRVLAIDLRGHGESSTVMNEYDINEMADDIAGILKSLEVQKAILFGHSLGGYVSLAFAEKYPDKISGLGLIHSTAFPDSEEAKENRVKGIKKIKEVGIEPFIDDLIPKLFRQKKDEKIASEISFAKQIGNKTPSTGAISALNAMKNRKDRRVVLQNLDLPILLVAGKEDQVIPKEKTFTTEGSHVTEVLLENSGHMGMLEEPDRLIDVMYHFIETSVAPKPEE